MNRYFNPIQVILFLPIVLMVGISIVHLHFTDSIFEGVTKCYQRGCFDIEQSKELESIVMPLVKDTRFMGQVNLDEPPRQESLNIYVATDSLPKPFDTIKCNCAYVGSSTIICDAAFIKSFSRAVNFTQDSFYGKGSKEIWNENESIFSQANDQISKVLKTWIIGHEIGHAELHDTGSANRRRKMTRQEEIDADVFFLNKMFFANDIEKNRPLHSSISQFIFGIVSIAYNSSEQKGKATIAPSSNGIHPPWVFRALHLGQTMSDRNPSGRKNDFYESLKSHLVVSPNGLEIGSFCEYQNLKEIGAEIQKNQ